MAITFDEKLEAAWGLHKIEKAVLEKEVAELRAENEQLRKDLKTAIMGDSAELQDVKRENEKLRFERDTIGEANYVNGWNAAINSSEAMQDLRAENNKLRKEIGEYVNLCKALKILHEQGILFIEDFYTELRKNKND